MKIEFEWRLSVSVPDEYYHFECWVQGVDGYNGQDYVESPNTVRQSTHLHLMRWRVAISPRFCERLPGQTQ